MRVFLDDALRTGDNFVVGLDDALRDSSVLAVILSGSAVDRPWVIHEWTTFRAKNGPIGRVIPVLLEPVAIPTGLAATQAIDATDRDVRRVSLLLARAVRRADATAATPPELPSFAPELTFVVGRRGDELEVVGADGRARTRRAPFDERGESRLDLHLFRQLAWQPVTSPDEWRQIDTYAANVGRLLYDSLFDDQAAALLRRSSDGGTPTAVTIISQDQAVLALPWELLHDGTRFLVRDGIVDMLRTTVEGSFSRLLAAPADYLKLLVTVAAPDGYDLNYEEESYRIARVLSERCDMIVNELGTVDDLVRRADRHTPTGVHFSGHGGPGSLFFETDENAPDPVSIERLVQRLRAETAGGLPRFFYLACCHGNTQPPPLSGGSELSAAHLHREGAPEVVAYFGPIAEHLSTRAEETLYAALAAGKTTRFAVRQARLAMIDGRDADAGDLEASPPAYPFAWSQLVFYRRGPEYALSLPVSATHRLEADSALERTFQDAGNRRILITGFIGRRTELHDIRRRLRQGQRVFVFHGMGGLGKTTLAVQALALIAEPQDVCAIWSQDGAGRLDEAERVVERITEYARLRFADQADALRAMLDEQVSGDVRRRCQALIDFLLARVSRLVLYVDNLESLLSGPDAEIDDAKFAEWRSPELLSIWQLLTTYAENSDRLYLVASSRYVNDSMALRYRLPLAPLSRGALFRLMKWLPGLRRLSAATRARLAERLTGHPRAAELADGLVAHALEQWESVHGRWSSSDPAEEWDRLLAPVLPDVQQKLESDLLLDAIWRHVLDDPARRMLYRMTLLNADRWSWTVVKLLGDRDQSLEASEATARKLNSASLLVTFDQREEGAEHVVRYYNLHPTTSAYVLRQFAGATQFTTESHGRLGGLLWFLHEEAPPELLQHRIWLAATAASHLLLGAAYDPAAYAARTAADDMLQRAQWRQVIALLTPFTAEEVMSRLKVDDRSAIYDQLSRAYRGIKRFDEARSLQEKAIEAATESNDANLVFVALSNMANLRAHAADYDGAMELASQLREKAMVVDYPESKILHLVNLGMLFSEKGELDEATSLLREASRLAAEVEDFPVEDITLNLGVILARQERIEEAIEAFSRAAECAKRRNRPISEEAALQNLGAVRRSSGQRAAAIEAFERALPVTRTIGDRERELRALIQLTSALRESEEWPRFLDYSRQALRIASQLGDRRASAKISFEVGFVFYRDRDWAKAAAAFQDALNASEQTDDHDLTSLCLGMLADSFDARGDRESLLATLKRSIEFARQHNLAEREMKALNNLGGVLLERGELTDANVHIEESLRLAREHGQQAMEIDARRNVAALHAKRGEVEDAIAEYEWALWASQQLGDELRERRMLESLFNFADQLDRPDLRAGRLTRLLALQRNAGARDAELRTRIHLGLDTAASGDLAAAAEHCREALALASELADKGAQRDLLMTLSEIFRTQGSTLEEIDVDLRLLPLLDGANEEDRQSIIARLGVAYAKSGDAERAMEYLGQAIRAARQSGNLAELLNPLTNLGGLYIRLARWDEAVDTLEEAVAIARQTRNRRIEGPACGNLGIAWIGKGDRTRARDILQQALEIGRETNDGRLIDIASEYLQRLI